MRRLKGEPGAGVWLAGALVDEIDVLVLKRYPIVLGDGIPLFGAGAADARPFDVVDERTISGGTQVSTYARAT